MHRSLLQFFVLVGGLGVLLAAVSFTTPRLIPAAETRQSAQPSTRQAAWAARVAERAPDILPQAPARPEIRPENESLPLAEPRSAERPATGPLQLIEQPPLVNAAVAPPATQTPPPAKPATVTNSDIVARLDHPSCKLPPYTKEVAKQNLASVGSLDPAEASRAWDTFDEFCRRDFSLFYEIQKSEDLARSRPAPNAPLPSEKTLEGIALSPEALQQVEEFVSSVWRAQGYTSEFPGEGVLKPRSEGALGAAIPGATAPLGIQCGGRTAAPQGLGPNWWTCKCTGCCVPCKFGCCLPSCELGCRPYAYLWDSITGICGCGL